MRVLAGVFGIIAGIILGLYLGFWVCFIGGIIGVATVVAGLLASHVLMTSLLVISIIKIIFSSLAGYISAIILIIPSLAVLRK